MASNMTLWMEAFTSFRGYAIISFESVEKTEADKMQAYIP